tara:strand:+ start:270 stop:536 length:267 start_codon:yes stop_codon:yes gene_type:complete
MAKSIRNKNYHRYKAMVKFGKETEGERFMLAQLADYMNNYIGTNGRIHKQTTVSQIQLTSLLRMHPNFRYWPTSGRTGEWSYFEDEEE